MNPLRSSPAPMLLHAKNLGRKRKPEGWLFRGLSLEIQAGERIGLVGSTGAGKTLLLRSLVMLDPLDEGEIHWHGEPVTGLQVPMFRAKAMYLSQLPTLLTGTVLENLRAPFSLRSHQSRFFSIHDAEKLLALAGRSRDFLSKDARTLSGGERQIAALVRAILLEPTLLLLDEPTASLDAESAEALERLTLRWFESDSARRSFVWVSHTPPQMDRITHRVLFLQNGTLTESATTS